MKYCSMRGFMLFQRRNFLFLFSIPIPVHKKYTSAAEKSKNAIVFPLEEEYDEGRI